MDPSPETIELRDTRANKIRGSKELRGSCLKEPFQPIYWKKPETTIFSRGQGIGFPLAKIDTVFENDFI